MLMGEEMIVILPLIIIMSLLIHKAKMSQQKAVIISTIITALLFGAIHLATYDWNLFQCFAMVALSHIPFTIVSLKHDFIVPGMVGHIFLDWLIFGIYIATQL